MDTVRQLPQALYCAPTSEMIGNDRNPVPASGTHTVEKDAKQTVRRCCRQHSAELPVDCEPKISD